MPAGSSSATSVTRERHCHLNQQRKRAHLWTRRFRAQTERVTASPFAGFTVCPAVTSGNLATLYQAVTAFERGAHPDFGAAAPGSYELDPGVLARALDPDDKPVYAPRAQGTATTAGACRRAAA